MSHLVALWAFAKSVPRVAYAVLLGAGLLYWAHSTIQGKITDAYARGRAFERDKASVNGALIEASIAARAASLARVDTVFRYVKSQASTVDRHATAAATLARQLPAEIAALPAIVELRAAVFATESAVKVLKDSIKTLDERIVDERAASAMALSVLKSELVEARLVSARHEQSLAEEKARPKRTVKATVVTAMIGAAIAESIRFGISLVRR